MPENQIYGCGKIIDHEVCRAVGSPVAAGDSGEDQDRTPPRLPGCEGNVCVETISDYPGIASDPRSDQIFHRLVGLSRNFGLYDDRMDFSEMLALFHGHDERVSVESVGRTTRLYTEIFHRFLSPEA